MEVGLLFEEGNVDELRDCIQVPVSDRKLREKMRGKARKFAEENLSYDVIAREFLGLLSSFNVLCRSILARHYLIRACQLDPALTHVNTSLI